jgi:hypothetical protein
VFEEVESFCLFVGYTRSGHSIVGTILDAHPEAAIAHEQPLFSRSFRSPTTGTVQHASRERLFAKLLEDTQYRVELGRRGSRRTADRPMPLVPGGSHGRTTTLRVIGTKRGQEAPVAWGMNPAVLDDLRELVGVPLRLVHVYRNPWDNVASMMRQSPDRAIVRYFSRARAIAEIKAAGLPVHDLALEDLIDRPHEAIASLLRFCGLEADNGWLDGSASILDAEPHASRREHEWTERELKGVELRMEGIPWLDRYPRAP